MTRDIEVAVKTSIPTQTKKVTENEGNASKDVADYNIGDTVPFTLTSKVPNMHYYDTYYFAFHDKMDAGLTFVPSSVVVTIGGKTVDAADYTLKYVGGTSEPSDSDTFCLIFTDLKDYVSDNLADIKSSAADVDAAAGETVTVTFNAVLNANAQVGDATGNKNESHLEYSNNPDTNGHGETTPDKVIVFTYTVKTTKVDGEDANKKLGGAKFVRKRSPVGRFQQ